MSDHSFVERSLFSLIHCRLVVAMKDYCSIVSLQISGCYGGLLFRRGFPAAEGYTESRRAKLSSGSAGT